MKRHRPRRPTGCSWAAHSDGAHLSPGTSKNAGARRPTSPQYQSDVVGVRRVRCPIGASHPRRSTWYLVNPAMVAFRATIALPIRSIGPPPPTHPAPPARDYLVVASRRPPAVGRLADALHSPSCLDVWIPDLHYVIPIRISGGIWNRLTGAQAVQ